VDNSAPPWSEDAPGNETGWKIGSKDVLVTASYPLELADLRLVIKHKNRDVILDTMRIPREDTKISDDGLSERPIRRWIPGTDIQIFTPAKVDEDPEKTYYSSDTFQEAVDQESYVPFMALPPFPQSVISEFRKPMDKTNTRIPLKHAQRLMKKEARAELKKQAGRSLMLDTPVKDAYRREMAAVRVSRPDAFSEEPTLANDTVSRLAEYMNKHISIGNSMPVRKTQEQLNEIEQQRQRKIKAVGGRKSNKKYNVKFAHKVKNDAWKARKAGKMARKTQKIESNKTFEREPLRLRRKKPVDQQYEKRDRR
jgi:hypothetical protein